MKTYEIKVEFCKTYRVKAKNADEANGKLLDAIGEDEFSLGVDGKYYEVEDEPITCPDCNGDGIDQSSLEDAYDSAPCPRCGGECEITPEEYHDDESLYN